MSERVAITGPYAPGSDEAAVQARFEAGEYPVAVYGLGKMGLPLAGVFAETCGNVLGVDIDPDVVRRVNRGECHVKREPGLDGLVSETVVGGALEATTSPREAAEQASIHVIIVPTPITEAKEPDLAILSTVVEDIARGLDPGDLVLLESTVPPHTTSENVLPSLVMHSDLAQEEFGVAFCPERTMSGRALKDIRGAYPKVVGGVDEESTRAASAIYESFNSSGVIPVSDATTAESVKVFEGVYRDIDLAIANQLATYAGELGIDAREAFDVANTQPFCDLLNPGPGVGGHCIPFYPYFLLEPFETPAPLLEAAREVNDGMPRYTVELLEGELIDEGKNLVDARIAVLGLTYKPSVEEIRASPAIGVSEELRERGADVYGVDPMLDSVEEFALEQIGLDELYEMELDGVVIVTPHPEFADIEWGALRARDGSVVVIDGRDSLDFDEDGSVRVVTLGGR